MRPGRIIRSSPHHERIKDLESGALTGWPPFDSEAGREASAETPCGYRNGET